MEGRTKRVFVNLLFIGFLTQFTGFSDGQTLTLRVLSAVERGRDTVFTCTGGASPYIFRWDDLTVVPNVPIFTAGEVVYPDDQTKYFDFSVSENGETSIMTITNTQIEDEGKYRCAEGSLHVFANFTVEVQSTWSLLVESIMENNIDMYEATCELLGGRPDETITWMLGSDPAPCENPEPTPLPSDPGLFSKRSICKYQATPDNNGQPLKCVIGGHLVTELNGEETHVLDMHIAPCTCNEIVTVTFQSFGLNLRVTCDIDATHQPTPAIRNYYIYVNDTLKHVSTTGVNSVEIPGSEYDLSTEFECVAGNYLGNTTSGKTTYVPINRVTKSLQVLQTIKVLYNLSDQPNIVKCLGYCKEQGSILYEFISGGTLLTHLQTSGLQSQPTYSKPNGVRIEEGTLLNLAWQVAKGMQFLASKKITHGALCAHNVLLGERKQCKISDYGLSSSISGDVAKPTRWSSPETMVTGDQTTEGDIWSFGIILWEIVTLGARPYPNMTFGTVQTEVAKGYQMPRPRHCAQEVYAVMTGCWEKEPINRSNFDHILKTMEMILEKTHSYLSLNDLDERLYASTLDLM
nr:fibroblast growth factor receptor 2-like [Lytechinus pictus]